MVKSVQIFEPFAHSEYSTRLDQPALLKGMAATWPAADLWTPEYFRQRFGHCEVAVSHYQSKPDQRPKNKFKAALATYLDVVDGKISATEKLNADAYVAGWHFQANAPELMEDIRIPRPFQDNLLDRVDREIINYPSMSVFIGHSRAETPLHTDSFAVCVWLATLRGRKTIRVIPPVDYANIRNAMDSFDEANVRRWSSLGIPVFEAVVEAGDIVVIPPGYWHQVKNEGFTVAVSTNYLSPFHFLTFEQQLKAKILAPYLRLLKLKRELLSATAIDHSSECLKNFDFVKNESRFLDHLSVEIEREKEVLGRVRELVGG